MIPGYPEEKEIYVAKSLAEIKRQRGFRVLELMYMMMSTMRKMISVAISPTLFALHICLQIPFRSCLVRLVGEYPRTNMMATY